MSERAARTETQSIETDAPVTAVLSLLADPTKIPRWAPDFADQVRSNGPSGWLASKDGRDFQLRAAVSPGSGTVDYLREIAPGQEGGAYIRVVPRPRGGSVVTMTLPLLPGVDPAETRATLSRELNALVSLLGTN